MFILNFSALYFISLLYIINTQGTPLSPEEFAKLNKTLHAMHPFCLPTGDGLNFQTQGLWGLFELPPQECNSLTMYPELKKTNRSFYCCEVKMKAKEGKGPKEINGCVAVMKKSIDDNRYEDILHYFKDGKQYKLLQYYVMLGKTAFDSFNGTYLPMINGTKYDVEMLDCFSGIMKINSFIILALLFLIL